MTRIKPDVPMINLIDMGFTCNLLYLYDKEYLVYKRIYNGRLTVICDDEDREIRIWEGKDMIEPRMYTHDIRDLVRKSYAEEVNKHGSNQTRKQ